MKEITELLSNGLLVICWPSMHTRDEAAMLNGYSKPLGGILGAPVSLLL